MKNAIVVAGGTGNLGGRIVHALVGMGAQVIVPYRPTSKKDRIERLLKKGVRAIEVDYTNKANLIEVCEDAICVVSALQGLKDVIVDTQSALLDAAVAAGVPRFIPSDFSLDFTKINSENRNFDLRRAFHVILDRADISATSIFNGAFAEILGYNTPLLDLKKKSIGYWGSKADWHLDFTTMDDTAAFTAAAALDASTPRRLNIASFQVSPLQIQELASELTGSRFALTNMGSLKAFDAFNRHQRAADPAGENQTFPRWQSGQYMHDQFITHHDQLDNNRYPNLTWTTAGAFLSSLL